MAFDQKAYDRSRYLANREQIIARSVKWGKENPHKKASYKRKKKYGLTEAEHAKLVIDQQAKCKICGITASKLHVDHDLKTGKVRGLLCHHCNTMLGYARDCPDILLAGAGYLITGELNGGV